MKNKKLNIEEVLSNQKEILENQKKIIKKEEKLEDIEKKLKKDEKEDKKLLKELEKVELHIKNDLNSTLTKVTKRDLFKGFIGATIGVLGHFAFYKGYEISQVLSVFQATILFFSAFILLNIILFYAGFRNIEKTYILKFMPLRSLTLFGISIFSIIVINSLFGILNIFTDSLKDIYILISTNLIIAVIGAATADLIGKNE